MGFIVSHSAEKESDMLMLIAADIYGKLNRARPARPIFRTTATKGAALVRFQAAQRAVMAREAHEGAMCGDRVAELPV